jgi:hypothetical protein
LVPDLSDAAAAVLDPAHVNIVSDTNSRANRRVGKEISQVRLKAEGISGRNYVTATYTTCLKDPVIILQQSASRMVAFIAGCPYRQQLEMKQNE